MSTPLPSDETIFAAALVRPASERAAFLDGACVDDPSRRARIESLLRAHDAAEQDFMRTAASAAPRITEPIAGEKIGRYKLLQKIGEGGCGIVYMAEQEEPVRRRVALKVIKLGMDTKEVVARFEAERQALALMDHPNIARVFDGGATDAGRPFFVMELVRGVPITKFCDEQNLPTAKRLELFTQVCHAVQHAHQKGIIHRDIKPSNILVTLHDGAPVPKVIDFGIAKATHGRLTDNTLFTAFEQFIGTPAYMSPEQAEMSGLDIDTRSDIYSLGVLLYELLTGRPPFDPKTLVSAGLDEIRRIIREVDPPRPSISLSTLTDADRATVAKLRGTAPAQLSTLLRGDLDWIVMRCLEKDRTRRYETANGLAADVQRHLHDEPVVARPPSAAYRVQKLIRRNRLVFAAGCAVAATLVLGAGLAIWQAVRANREAHRAVLAERSAMAEAEISKAVSGFLTEDLLLQAASHAQAERNHTPDPDLKVREALDRAAQTAGKRFERQPLVEAAVRTAIGTAYLGLGDPAKAAPHFERAVALRRRLLGPEHVATLATADGLARSYRTLQRIEESEKLARQALESRRRSLGPEHPDTLRSMQELSMVYRGRGKIHEASTLNAQVLEARKRVLGAEHRDTLSSMNDLYDSYRDLHKYAEADALVSEEFAIRKRVFGPDDPATLVAMGRVARGLGNEGKREEALALWKQTWESQKRVLGPEHPETLTTMKNLIGAYGNAGRHDEALAIGLQALEVQTRERGVDDINTQMLVNEIAMAYVAQRRYAEAAALNAQNLEVRKRTLGLNHPNTLQSMTGLAVALAGQGKFSDAVAVETELVPLKQRVLGPEHHQTLETMQTLGVNLLRLQKFAEAEAVLRPLASIRQKVAPDDWLTAVATVLVGEALLGQRRFAEAEKHLLEGYENETQRKASISHRRHAVDMLVQLYAAWEKPAAGADWRTKLAELNGQASAHNELNRVGLEKQEKGDLTGALADFDRAVASNPNHPSGYAYYYRARIKQVRAEHEAALRDYDRCIEIASLARPYAHLNRWVVRRHLNRPEATPELARAIGTWRATWQTTLGRFLVGKLTERELLNAVARGDQTAAAARECDALYFAGMKRLFDGDRTGARELLARCVATNQPQTQNATLLLARAELDRLPKSAR